MRGGKLRNRLQLQRNTPSGTALAEKTDNWVQYDRRWGAIVRLRGRELFAVQQTNPEINTRIELRYLDGVSSKDRVVLGSTVFNIISVIDVENRHIELHLLCKEIPA